MKLILQTIDKNTFEVTVPDDGTLQDLKNQISTIKNHPTEQLKLIYNGAILDNNTKKLTEYNLVDNTKIVVLLQKSKAEVKPPKADEPKVQEEPKPVQPSSTDANEDDETGQPGTVLNQFTNMINQNPEAFMQLLMSDPFISQVAQQNPQGFMQVISDPNFINNILQAEPSEEDSMYDRFFDGEIQLTDTQKQDVNDIVAMGFPFEDVIQYYIAYDHNKEMTINALFSERFGD